MLVLQFGHLLAVQLGLVGILRTLAAREAVVQSGVLQNLTNLLDMPANAAQLSGYAAAVMTKMTAQVLVAIHRDYKYQQYADENQHCGEQRQYPVLFEAGAG
jgi:replicative DNA helicase